MEQQLHDPAHAIDVSQDRRLFDGRTTIHAPWTIDPVVVRDGRVARRRSRYPVVRARDSGSVEEPASQEA